MARLAGVALLVLPNLAGVLHWKEACVQQVASQCCVHESVAVLLLEKHQGSAESACQAWARSPQGVLAFSVPFFILYSSCSRGGLLCKTPLARLLLEDQAYTFRPGLQSQGAVALPSSRQPPPPNPPQRQSTRC